MNQEYDPKKEFFTKKSLGQHFLFDPNILKKIVSASKVHPEDLVLEIGPGEGTLTAEILQAGATVVAIEKDDRLIPILKNKFEKEISKERFFLIHSDVLESEKELADIINYFPYKVIANIPYYITGKIIRWLLSLPQLPKSITLLVQDEVAKRIVSDKESLLSLSIKSFGIPYYRGKVKAGSFSPPPKVDSAILVIENISRDFFADLKEEGFFQIIKLAFSQKRKTLLNTLFSEDKDLGKKILYSTGLTENVRPENIELQEWKNLIHSMYEQRAPDR